jgi:tryptophan synthase alpha chain
MGAKIMSHMVSFYPDRETSVDIARALIDGGSSYLEIQFPFSDPSADGKYIQEACSTALREGFKVSLGFELVKKLKSFSDIPLFVMGYANTVYFKGVNNFLEDCIRAGVHGLIIPDLPPDYDEDLFSLGTKAGVHIVPVIAPTVLEERLERIMSVEPEYVYAVLRKGITGDYTAIGDDNLGFLKKLGNYGVKILAGFGISTREQVEALSPFVHASIIGTAFIRQIKENLSKSPYESVFDKIKEIKPS